MVIISYSIQLILSFAMVLGAGGTGPTPVRACGLHVVGQCFSDQSGLSRGSLGGTTISLIIDHPSGGLLAFEADDCTITCFEDDQGNDLRRSGPVDLHFQRTSRGATFSRDRRSAAIDINTDKLPSPGSRSIHLVGTLVFQEAHEARVFTSNDFALKTGSHATLGNITVVVKDVVEAKSYGDPHLAEYVSKQNRVTIATEGHPRYAIKSVRLLGKDGTSVAEARGGGYQRSNGHERTTHVLSVSAYVRKATIEITYWADLAPLEIPFSLTVGAGLE